MEKQLFFLKEHAKCYVLRGNTFGLCSLSSENEEAVLWPHRFGHNHFKNVKNLANHVSGMSLKKWLLINFVVVKLAKLLSHDGKQYREKMERRITSKHDSVFIELLGSMPTTSLGGNRRATFFTDSYSRYSAVDFLKAKEECLYKLKVFCAQVGTPRAIRSDNGKYCISKLSRNFCISNRIKREHTAPFSPHKTGVSQRR